jgi:alkaline phosphatase
VGIDHTGKELPTILDYAKQLGKSTGVLTTDDLYGGTPAGFTARGSDRTAYSVVTWEQATSGVDFLCGLRRPTHYASAKAYLSGRGYYFHDTVSGLDDALAANDKVFLTLNIENGTADALSLSAMTKRALEFLSRNDEGFVLVIEQAKIDDHCHNNRFPEMLERMRSLMDTVETVMDWVGDRTDTAVLVTADHETGGLTDSGDPTAFANTYDTGHGVISYSFALKSHTDQQVKLFVYGREVNFKEFDYYGSRHLIKNTDIYRIMKRLLDGNTN